MSCTVSYCIPLYCISLYCVASYCIVLYCIVLMILSLRSPFSIGTAPASSFPHLKTQCRLDSLCYLKPLPRCFASSCDSQISSLRRDELLERQPMLGSSATFEALFDVISTGHNLQRDDWFAWGFTIDDDGLLRCSYSSVVKLFLARLCKSWI